MFTLEGGLLFQIRADCFIWPKSSDDHGRWRGRFFEGGDWYGGQPDGRGGMRSIWIPSSEEMTEWWGSFTWSTSLPPKQMRWS